MNNLLGIYCFIRNGIKYDYPFIESIESAIPIADQIVINECSSEDNTLAVLQALKEKYPEKIKIIRDDWVTHHSQLSARGNTCIPHLTTQWHWQLQADEVLHEKDYEDIRRVLTDSIDKPIDAFKVHYWHFMANYETEFDFCYVKAARIARRGTNWWLSGDAAEISGGDTRKLVDLTPGGGQVLGLKELSDIRVFHYGKVKEGKIGWQKEWDFTHLYTDIGFPDPKMMEMKEKFGEEFCDYVYIFEGAIDRGEVRHFTGTHPKVMSERIENFKSGGYEQFISRFKNSLDLKKLESMKVEMINEVEERDKELTQSDKNRIYECKNEGKTIVTMDEYAKRMKYDWNKRAIKDAPFYITGNKDSSPEWLRHIGKIDYEKHFLQRFEKLYATTIVDTILELGVGIGRMAEYLSKHCKQLIATDISFEFLNVAKRRLDAIGVHNVDYFELEGSSLIGIKQASIDLVFEYIVFQHIGSFDIIISYLEDIKRVLKKDGHFIMHARANDVSAPNDLNINNTFHGCNVTLTMMINAINDIEDLEIVEHNTSNNDYWGIIKKN